MSSIGQRGNQTGDLRRALTPTIESICFYCNRPGATDFGLLGAGMSGTGGARISRCPEGTGCRDGRIYHGPPTPPHWPDADCKACLNEARAPQAQRRRPTNRNRR